MIFDLFITLLYFCLNLYEFTRKRDIDFYVQKTLKHVVKFWNEGLDLFLKTEDNFLFFFFHRWCTMYKINREIINYLRKL